MLDADLIPDQAIKTREEDLLDLAPSVDAIGELVLTLKTSFTVGIFGPWGSGKSSFGQLLAALLAPRRDVTFVTFDAWKYQETPLRRHVLSVISRQVDPGDEPTVYQRTRTTKYRFTRAATKTLLSAAIVFAVSTIVLIGLVATIQSMSPPNPDWFKTFAADLAEHLPSIILSTSIVAPVATVLLNEMKVELDEAEPSTAEQFAELFGNIVAKVVARGQRLVVFVDELDRASAKSIDATLDTLKTFLELEGCVFLVAADQIALEQAVERADQRPRPVRQNPYYSAGSEYIDKIFQYQYHLPPIDAPAMTRFAVDLVKRHGGVWARLSDEAESIVSVLIPSHVRSPRRVKVLLNAFAIAHRNATDRLGELSSRQRLELAKLVCLRTEFPLFHRHVVDRPSVLNAINARLNDRDPGQLTHEAQHLTDAVLAGEFVPDVASEDPTGTGSFASLGDLLLNYLKRTRDILGPDRELIYLKKRPQFGGLGEELTRSLETAALDRKPDEAINVLTGLDAEGQAAALRYMVDVIDASAGIETSNAIEVLFEVTPTVHPEALRLAAPPIVRLALGNESLISDRPNTLIGLSVVVPYASDGQRTEAERFMVRVGRVSTEARTMLLLSAQTAFAPDSPSWDDVRNELSELVAEDVGAALAATNRMLPQTVATLWRDSPARRLGVLLSADPTADPPRALATVILQTASPTGAWQIIRPSLQAAIDSAATAAETETETDEL